MAPPGSHLLSHVILGLTYYRSIDILCTSCRCCPWKVWDQQHPFCSFLSRYRHVGVLPLLLWSSFCGRPTQFLSPSLSATARSSAVRVSFISSALGGWNGCFSVCNGLGLGLLIDLRTHPACAPAKSSQSESTVDASRVPGLP
jgi:hypothetical protein